MARSGRELQVYSVFRLGDLGLDLKTSPLELTTVKRRRGALTKAQHVDYRTSGGVSKRLPLEAINSTTLGASVKITGGIQFRHSNGNTYDVCGTSDGRLVKLNTDGTTTNLVTGLTADRRWSFAVYNDKVICCNGADAPRKYDGTTVGTLGGSPPATGALVVAHSNRVFMLDETQKSRLSWSALNNEEDWTTASNAGSVSVNPNDSQNLESMVSASASELVMGKRDALYRLQGTAPSTYAITNVVPAGTTAGAISRFGMVYALNDVWMLALGGLHDVQTVQAFGDLRVAYASERISPRFQIGSDFTVTLGELDEGCVAYDRQHNRIMVAVDSDGDTKNDLLLGFDLYLRAWHEWPGLSIASMWPAINRSTGQVEVWAGGYDGVVRALNRDVTGDAYTAEVRHISCLDAPGLEKSPRYLFLYLKEEGNWSVTVDTKFDFGAAGGQSYTASLLGATKTLGVNWTLGTDPLGARDQLVKRLDLAGIGEFLEIGMQNGSAGQPFTWLGYEVMWRPRRVVRAAA